jgi:hypothetical protein
VANLRALTRSGEEVLGPTWRVQNPLPSVFLPIPGAKATARFSTERTVVVVTESMRFQRAPWWKIERGRCGGIGCLPPRWVIISIEHLFYFVKAVFAEFPKF